MKKHVAAPLPAVPGIDLSFRPQSYFWPLALETHLLARIKGAQRKAALNALIDAGQLDEIPDLLARSALSEAERQAIGQVHPALMSGEYLPDLKKDEVEIARIALASVTGDVISLRARRNKNGEIYYRMVDEYGDDRSHGPIQFRPRSSKEPLSMGQLVALLDHARYDGAYDEERYDFVIRGVIEFNLDNGMDLEGIFTFVTVSSDYYPYLQRYFAEQFCAWYEARAGEVGNGSSEYRSPSEQPQASPPPETNATPAVQIPTVQRTGPISKTEGAAYSEENSATTVSFGYFRTPTGKPPGK